MAVTRWCLGLLVESGCSDGGARAYVRAIASTARHLILLLFLKLNTSISDDAIYAHNQMFIHTCMYT